MNARWRISKPSWRQGRRQARVQLITGDIAAYVNSNRLTYSALPFRPE